MVKVPVIPENAPFSAEQRLWLNGFLAGLFATCETSGSTVAEVPAKPAVPLLILFGSQTGTAEKVARNLAKESKTRGCNPRVVDAVAFTTIDWATEKNLLVVTSTYGDGDMPDNAQAFWDWLKSDAAKPMPRLRYSVLALGDTNYAEFCAAGKKIDARLAELGAKQIHPCAECDVDYEARAKEWITGALGQLSSEHNSAAETNGSVLIAGITSVAATVSEGYSKKNPFPARLLANRRLNAEGSEKETRHYEISLEGSGLNYEAGDALGIVPVNCTELVDDVLQALGFDGEEAVAGAEAELPLRKALAVVYDVSKPSTELLQRVSENNAVLRELLAPERKDELKKWLWGRGVVDLLLETPSAKFAPAEFVTLLKTLAPRLYSIASSPKAHAGQVHLTINTVRYEAHGRPRKGVASTFLADRVGDADFLKVFVQPSHGFKPPSTGETPMIMVGPGTGVAPFRGFLHERRATDAKGRNWLFFGEQRAATDFYYREELEQMLRDGHLTKLSTAFSRDQAEKIYVQNRMLENAAELWSWLQDGANFYVCGDAARMAKDVDAALHQIVETAGGLGKDGAAEYIKKLKTDKRYQRDVY